MAPRNARTSRGVADCRAARGSSPVNGAGGVFDFPRAAEQGRRPTGSRRPCSTGSAPGWKARSVWISSPAAEAWASRRRRAERQASPWWKPTPRSFRICTARASVWAHPGSKSCTVTRSSGCAARRVASTSYFSIRPSGPPCWSAVAASSPHPAVSPLTRCSTSNASGPEAGRRCRMDSSRSGRGERERYAIISRAGGPAPRRWADQEQMVQAVWWYVSCPG